MPEMDTQAQPQADTQAPESNEFESQAIPETYAGSWAGKYKTLGEVFKGGEEANKLIGAKGVIVPGEKATQEEWDKYYNTLGRPEKPDGYKLTPLEKLHPELTITPEGDANFKALMHKHGITAKQADGLYKEFYGMANGTLTKRDEKMQADKHQAEAQLRQDWGPDYDKHINSAKRLIEKFGGPNAREAFGDMGNNPQVLKTIANIARKFSEDGFVKGADVQNSEAKDAQVKLTDIMLNKEHPYWKQGAGHAEAIAEVKRLNSIIHPEIEV